MNSVRKVQVVAMFRAEIACSLGGRAGRMCVWIGWVRSCMGCEHRGQVQEWFLAITHYEQSVGFTRACMFRPGCAASRQVLEEPVEPPDWPGPSPPIPPTTSEV